MYTSMWIVIDLWHVSYQKSTVISFYLEWYVEFYLKLQSITLASISPFLIWKKKLQGALRTYTIWTKICAKHSSPKTHQWLLHRSMVILEMAFLKLQQRWKEIFYVLLYGIA